ncbi:hypothetical protein HanRHA438_Chr11g0518211 [Helianthus annuus]|nr:hypothetical protein HanRHA438_Chr11g0518211 [Helianthus annuus]
MQTDFLQRQSSRKKTWFKTNPAFHLLTHCETMWETFHLCPNTSKPSIVCGRNSTYSLKKKNLKNTQKKIKKLKLERGVNRVELMGWWVEMFNPNPTHIIIWVKDFDPNPHTYKLGSTRTRPV